MLFGNIETYKLNFLHLMVVWHHYLFFENEFFFLAIFRASGIKAYLGLDLNSLSSKCTI